MSFVSIAKADTLHQDTPGTTEHAAPGAWSSTESIMRPPLTGYRAGLVATLSALAVYLVATGSETVVIERFQPGEMELTWISDVVLAVAFGFAVFLWLHLRGTRLALSRLERAHITLDVQLSLAADIQRGLLPPVPADGGGIRWAARLVQAGRIGGDVYDFVRCNGSSWLVLVGDVSGKGVPAALVLGSIRTMFRMMATETTDPGELVERMSRRLHADHGGVPYLTCVIVRVDVDRRELAYVNAGHPAGILVDTRHRTGEPLRLASGGPPAGMFPDTKYATASIPVDGTMTAVFVTDGISEAFDVLGVGDAEPIAAALARLPHPLLPGEICQMLIERTAPALGRGGWQDDRTVVAVALEP